jgi:hypothetical protein
MSFGLPCPSLSATPTSVASGDPLSLCNSPADDPAANEARLCYFRDSDHNLRQPLPTEGPIPLLELDSILPFASSLF